MPKLTRPEAFHNHDQALVDQERSYELYDQLASIAKPHLMGAITRDNEDFTTRDWLEIGESTLSSVIDACLPGKRLELSRDEIRSIKRELNNRIKSQEHLADETEVELLSHNCARSVINTWITDLKREHKLGVKMQLNAGLSRRGTRYAFLNRALAPFRIGEYENVFKFVMHKFARELFEASAGGPVTLTRGLVLVPVNDEIYNSTWNPFSLVFDQSESEAIEEAKNNQPAREDVAIENELPAVAYAFSHAWLGSVNEFAREEESIKLSALALPMEHETNAVNHAITAVERVLGPSHRPNEGAVRKVFGAFEKIIRNSMPTNLILTNSLALRYTDSNELFVERTKNEDNDQKWAQYWGPMHVNDVFAQAADEALV